MKNLIYLFVFFFVMPLFSQETSDDMGCITNVDYGPDPEGVYSYATTFDSDLSTNPPMVLNIKFWILRQDDGTTI